MSEANFLEKYKQLRTMGLHELHEIWKHYDRDGSGYIEAGPELNQFLTDMLVAGGLQATELEVEDFVEGVLDMFDVDANGKLDFAEVEQLLNDDS